MKALKSLFLIIVIIFIGIFHNSCEDIGINSLEKPPSTDVTIDTIFSSAEYAERVLWNSYRSLRSGILRKGRSHALGQCLLADITDISHNWKGWGPSIEKFYSGNLNAGNVNDKTWTDPAVFLPYEDFPNHGIFTFSAMRACYVFLNHVHKVPDMSEEYRERLKAESKMIIAYNMTELFRNYGGVPWIGKAYSPDDDFTNPRMTVEATVDSIVKLMDEAIPNLPWQIPEGQMSNWAGRFTQAGAMALKVRLLLFAASPLFNSNQPYMAGEAADLKLSWYGDFNSSRWQRAADAAKELIDKIDAQGGYGLEMPVTNDVKGYREAFRKAWFKRESSEVLISVRDGYEGPIRWQGNMYDTNLNYGNGTVTSEYMRMFPMADGTPITDPASGWNEFVNPLGTEGVGAARKFNRDPRLYETVIINGDDWGGERVEMWGNTQFGIAKHMFGPPGRGNMVIRKFIPGYASGFPVQGHHYPMIRLPEIYLSYAEALNELGQQTEAYKYINKVRNRVGLKNIEQVGAWSQETLREQILIERATEFGFEQIRWFDMTRHKLENVYTKELHHLMINKNANGSFTYTYPKVAFAPRLWWTFFEPKWYLTPFSIDEMQKGYGLIQNPGW